MSCRNLNKQGSKNMAANDRVLLKAGYLKNVRPATEPGLKTD
jgi:hypothetical protein